MGSSCSASREQVATRRQRCLPTSSSVPKVDVAPTTNDENMAFTNLSIDESGAVIERRRNGVADLRGGEPPIPERVSLEGPPTREPTLLSANVSPPSKGRVSPRQHTPTPSLGITAEPAASKRTPSPERRSHSHSIATTGSIRRNTFSVSSTRSGPGGGGGMWTDSGNSCVGFQQERRLDDSSPPAAHGICAAGGNDHSRRLSSPPPPLPLPLRGKLSENQAAMVGSLLSIQSGSSNSLRLSEERRPEGGCIVHVLHEKDDGTQERRSVVIFPGSGLVSPKGANTTSDAPTFDIPPSMIMEFNMFKPRDDADDGRSEVPSPTNALSGFHGIQRVPRGTVRGAAGGPPTTQQRHSLASGDPSSLFLGSELVSPKNNNDNSSRRSFDVPPSMIIDLNMFQPRPLEIASQDESSSYRRNTKSSVFTDSGDLPSNANAVSGSFSPSHSRLD